LALRPDALRLALQGDDQRYDDNSEEYAADDDPFRRAWHKKSKHGIAPGFMTTQSARFEWVVELPGSLLRL